MPFYNFKCNKCNHSFEEFMQMSEYCIPKECPKCKSESINRVYELDHNAKTGDFITVGSLADKNGEKLGSSGKKKMYEKHTEYLRNREDHVKLKERRVE